MLVLVLLLLQDTPEVERLVDELGSTSIEKREAAHGRLLEIGAKALPALRKAGESTDPEVQSRAIEAIETIERLEKEARHDAAMRRRVFRPARSAGRALNPCLTDDAAFEFQTKHFKCGTVLQTWCSEHSDIEWDVATVFDESGKELAVERCGRCSPGLVYVAYAGPIHPRILGTRLWFSEYEIVFDNPKNGERRKVGDFTIEVDWPDLKITSRRGWTEDVMDRVCEKFEFELKPGLESHDTMGIGGGAGGGGRYGGRFGGDRPFWCRCEDGPQPVAKQRPELSRECTVGGGDRWYPVDQVAKITLKFRKPVEESFDLKAPVLRR